MIGMILAGGMGKRLRPITYQTPKPLIEIKEDYTILDKQLFDFKSAGIDHVILLTGYLHEKIEERYNNKYKGVTIEYSIEDEPLGTLNAIRMGLEKVDNEEVIIRNGDVVADLNIKKMIQQFKVSDYSASMFITKMRSPYGIVDIGEDRIKSFHEKPLLDYYINGGIYCFKEEVYPLFNNFESGDIEKTVFPLLSEQNKFTYYREDGLFWMSIDTTKDLEEIKKEYVNRIDKPWGYEKILIHTEKYLTKELYIKEGYQTSFHYHQNKDETMYVVKGCGYVEFEDTKKYFSRNDTVRIEPNTPHTIVATENTFLHEVSTPHPEDTIRIKDFYER
ncbi:MAG TPA: cupin domain-containing protein [Methanosarcinales archaeon]|nr:cupin domain-containing protein [Methanosarcinales archaeon]